MGAVPDICLWSGTFHIVHPKVSVGWVSKFGLYCEAPIPVSKHPGRLVNMFPDWKMFWKKTCRLPEHLLFHVRCQRSRHRPVSRRPKCFQLFAPPFPTSSLLPTSVQHLPEERCLLITLKILFKYFLTNVYLKRVMFLYLDFEAPLSWGDQATCYHRQEHNQYHRQKSSW